MQLSGIDTSPLTDHEKLSHYDDFDIALDQTNQQENDTTSIKYATPHESTCTIAVYNFNVPGILAY